MAYTEDKQPSGLSTLTDLANDDTVIVGDTSDVNEVVKTISWTNLKTAISTYVEGLTSYFNKTTNTLDDITTGVTNVHFTATDNTKLDGIETAADVTDETNVVAALSGATLTDLGVPASADRVLLQDASDSNNLKYADFSDFAGSGDMSAATYDPASISEQLVGLTATQTLTNKTLTTPTITLKQSTTPTPTAEGDIQWDTDNNQIKVGDGASTLTFTDDANLSITESQISDLGAYITDVVSDTTPQLGGSLDVNGNKIVSTANGNIDIEPNGTGNVLLGNYTFDADQTVGAGQDNYVLTYDNGTGLISLEAAAGGGGGDVTASANITDNAIVRGDGGAKGVQGSGWTISDTDALVNNANATGSWALEVAGDTLPASNIVASIATADATGTGLSTYKARGTLASPTATQSGDTLMFNGGRGYGATAYGSNSKGAFTVKATENWTDTNQGTELTFETTPNGSTTRAEQMQLDDGGLSLTTGNTYQINNVDVLSATTLGSSVVSSSLTSVGTLSSGNADAIVSAASTTTAGKVELATTAEVTTGTDNTRAITPSALNGADVTLADLEITGELYADAEVDDGNSGTADTIDWTTGMFHKSTMTGNCTYTFTAPSGPARVQLKLVQDGTGSRTATWPASVKWPGGTAPTLSTAASAIDIITFYYDGTNYFGVDSLNFS